MKTDNSKESKNRILQTVAEVSYTVDATNRTLGRVSSEAAQALLGKNSVHFVKNKVIPVQVTIVNASKMSMSERRLAGKEYTRASGYQGGFFKTSLPMLIEKKGIEEVLRRAVDGMIPRNRLRKERMKRLTIKN